MSVKENLIQIKNALSSNVTLVAVSKTKPNEMIMEAYEAGQRDFGENYVQELVDKQQQLPKDIQWHFIGHLQSNKVKLIVPFVYLIHGVDSVKLLQEINKQAQKNNKVINCLLQLFIAREETKFGFSFEECANFLRSELFSQLKNVKILGFMAMASNTDDEGQIRKEFRSLKEFSDKTSSILQLNFSVLSYGMSNDYKIAMEEGSTMIRIGSSIFGARNYTT
ncbi:MAG: YggS family pyridoxal phosphate-dependent enzyme [Bacteroidetes bacterium]|nr:YggS family pyridoxal phosphate-dependent enzyme [Bacteroidota bacterium]